MSELNKEDKIAIKQAYFDEYNQATRKCGKCDNGFILSKTGKKNAKGEDITDPSTVERCMCARLVVDKYSEYTAILKDDDIKAYDKDIEYRKFKGKQLFSQEELHRDCEDCGKSFGTFLLGRVRCPDCYSVYFKEFRMAISTFLDEKVDGGTEKRKRDKNMKVWIANFEQSTQQL